MNTSVMLDEKGELVDLSWLLPEQLTPPENDPKPRKPYPLSDAQADELISMYQASNRNQGWMIMSFGANNNRFYQRLERRGLIEKVGVSNSGRKHAIHWNLTEKGRSVASGLADLPF